MRTIHDKRTILNGNVKMKKSVRDENGLNEFLNLTYLIKPLPKNKMLVFGSVSDWLSEICLIANGASINLKTILDFGSILNMDQNSDGSKSRHLVGMILK